jgi:hypothetical protein
MNRYAQSAERPIPMREPPVSLEEARLLVRKVHEEYNDRINRAGSYHQACKLIEERDAKVSKIYKRLLPNQ